MKILGIVCEYNPLHNGHIHHLTQSLKESFDAVYVVMSGSFVQRGEPAVLSGFDRASLAMQTGMIDAVLQLPVAFSLSSAPDFCSYAVRILARAGVTHLSFGAETADLALLQSVASDNTLKQGAKTGRSHASLLGENHPVLSSPNNILAVEYLRAIKAYAPHIQPIVIKREGNYHEEGLTENFPSALAIRKHLIDKENTNSIKNYVPEHVFRLLNASDFNDTTLLGQLLIYKIRSSNEENLARINGISEGIEHRILRAADSAISYESLIEHIKTKRYTRTHICRTLCNILLDIDKCSVQAAKAEEPLLQVLAANKSVLPLLPASRILCYSDCEGTISNTHHALLSQNRRAESIFSLLIGKEFVNMNCKIYNNCN